MSKYIIKASGTMSEIITSLKALRAAFGKGCPLSTVAQVVQAQKLKNTIDEQLKKL